MAGKELLGIYVDEKLKGRVDKLADDLNVSTSHFVRRVLEFTVDAFEKFEREKAAMSELSDNDSSKSFKDEIKTELKEEKK